MSVRIEERGGRLVYDINTMGPAGKVRERRNAPDGIRTKAAATRWAEARQRHLQQAGREQPDEVPAPTLREFGPRWIRDYARAEKLKPSTIDAYERILRLHLYPDLGELRLDAIRELEIQRVKLRLEGKSDKTRANVLSLISEILKAAVEWDEIVKAPKIKLPGYMTPEMGFYDFEEWEQLVRGAERAGPMVRAAILLGGDAGLRRGEIVAFEQSDVGGGSLTVQRSEWEGRVGTPKGGKTRRIPLTSRLEQAIKDVKHLRGKRLLWQHNGRKVRVTTLQSWMEVATRRAGLPVSRNLHKLRHTFCSHLVMKGVPLRVVQELAGHADIKTTMRYAHLAKGSAEAAIALLESKDGWLTQRVSGAGVEQGSGKGAG